MTRNQQEKTPVDLRAFGMSSMSLRLWHGMALDVWLRTMRGKWHMVSPRRYPLAVTITLLSIGNLLSKGASAVIFDRLVANTQITPDPFSSSAIGAAVQSGFTRS